MNREQRREIAKVNGVPMPPAQGPPEPGFSPLPVTTGTAVAQTPEGPRVVLQTLTPGANSVYFLSVEHTEHLITELQAAVLQARSGIVIAKDVPT